MVDDRHSEQYAKHKKDNMSKKILNFNHFFSIYMNLKIASGELLRHTNCMLIKQKDIQSEFELRLNRAELNRCLFFVRLK